MLFLLSLLLRQGLSSRTLKRIIQVPFIWCQWTLLWPQMLLLSLASLIFLVREIVIITSQRCNEVEEQKNVCVMTGQKHPDTEHLHHTLSSPAKLCDLHTACSVPTLPLSQRQEKLFSFS